MSNFPKGLDPGIAFPDPTRLSMQMPVAPRNPLVEAEAANLRKRLVDWINRFDASTSSWKSLNECKTSEPPCAACGLLDSVENPHAAHGGSEVFSSNCYLRDFPDDVLV